jgi:hypothetical protein
MREDPVGAGAGVRDIVGAWFVCFAVAAVCWAGLEAAGAGPGRPPEALIGAEPAATVPLAEADRAEAHRHGRC